jgi:hypothetical protein
VKKILQIIFLFTGFLSHGQVSFETKSFGQKILDGKAKPSDDIKTFRLLDSLFCKNPLDKDFYFKVANKIQRVSDGALSEYFDGIASKYYLQYNSEFIDRLKTITKKDLSNWLGSAAIDIAQNEQSPSALPKIKKQLDELVANVRHQKKN